MVKTSFLRAKKDVPGNLENSNELVSVVAFQYNKVDNSNWSSPEYIIRLAFDFSSSGVAKVVSCVLITLV